MQLVPPGAHIPEYPNATAIPQALRGPDSSLAGITALVTGLGVSGYPMAVHLAERGAEVIVVDADTQIDRSERTAILNVFDVDIRRGHEHVMAIPTSRTGKRPDIVCTSQGWRPDQPLLVEAAKMGIPVIGEVELAWRVRGANSAPWLVVTGTNGKTTTTSMLASMLEAAGMKVRACGNIGRPLLEAVLDADAEVLAIELASFQLHWQFSMCAHSAVVLNLADDHLDWHGSAAAYREAKARAYNNVAKACVYNVADSDTRIMVEEAEVLPGARAIGFTLGVPGPGEFGVVDDLLVDRGFAPNRYSAAVELASLSDVAVATGAHEVPAQHNVANALAAAVLARSVGVTASAVRAGLLAHTPGEHRVATIAKRAGITWVEDSKGTNPHATAAALGDFAQVVWIAGGLAKGADYTELVTTHRDRIRAVVLIGVDPVPLQSALGEVAPDIPVYRVPADLRGRAVMVEAVKRAAQVAEDGDTVVLSPAAASMDQFTDYAERGNAFISAVTELIELPQ